MPPSNKTISVVLADLENSDHASGLLAVLDAYASDPVIGAGHLPDEVTSTLIDSLKTWPGAFSYLALDGEKVVGIINCFTHFSTFKAKPLINVHDAAVLTDYQGQGIGRKLFAAVIARAEELGCCKVTLEVYSNNLGAKALYENLGFVSEPGDNNFSYFMTRPL